MSNDNDWTLPEPTPKKRGILFLSPEDMQEAKKSMKEKGIKTEDVKNLPPIVVKVNSLYRYDKVESLLLNLLANVWMNSITLWLSKKILMLMLVDN